jgi:hypothetical protein
VSEGNGTSAHRGLGWRPYWDPRDRNHLMISHLERDLVGMAVPEEKVWQIGPILDQGEEGACVGYAWRAWMNARPIANRPERHIQARDIYHQAQLIDEFPGQEPTLSGTTVRAAAKIMVRDGHLAEYMWSGSADEILTWVRTKGPLVFSTYWFDSMTEPDENGYIEPAGRIVGGHAMCMYGVGANDDALIQQSWGEDHGLEGCIKMRREALSYLVSQGYVSACAAAQVRKRSMDE